MASQMFWCVQKYLLISVLVERSLSMDAWIWDGFRSQNWGLVQHLIAFLARSNLKFFGHHPRVRTGIEINRLQPYPVILLSVRAVKFTGPFGDRLSLKFGSDTGPGVPTDIGFRVLAPCWQNSDRAHFFLSKIKKSSAVWVRGIPQLGC